VLGTYPEKLSAAAQRALAARHVDVRVHTLVTAIDEHGVQVHGPAGDERIDARTVLWAAGVRASPLGESLGAPRDREGRVHVEPDLSLPGHPEVFVIGDLARVDSLPGVAQVALQGGRHVARIIAREGHAEKPKPSARPAFRYHDKGNLATIGRAEAVVATKHLAKSGVLAWMLWWVVHIYFLVGFRNRALVIMHWAWSWLTYKRGARLITGTIGQLPAITEPASPPTSTPPSAEPR
jgi:NADH dehydrogenase